MVLEENDIDKFTTIIERYVDAIGELFDGIAEISLQILTTLEWSDEEYPIQLSENSMLIMPDKEKNATETALKNVDKFCDRIMKIQNIFNTQIKISNNVTIGNIQQSCKRIPPVIKMMLNSQNSAELGVNGACGSVMDKSGDIQEDLMIEYYVLLNICIKFYNLAIRQMDVLKKVMQEVNQNIVQMHLAKNGIFDNSLIASLDTSNMELGSDTDRVPELSMTDIKTAIVSIDSQFKNIVQNLTSRKM
jgi:hypothetical protein